MEKKPQIDLLLLGKTASGKSATGNSILRRRVFKSCGDTSSVTNKIDWDVSEFDGRVIKVVDAPGIYDNSVDKSEAVNFVLNCLQEAMALSPEGYHAFLLVIKFGNRFTGEEQGTINFLKNAFGQNFVKEYCVLVMSGGDMFQDVAQDEDISFKDWCKKQTGQFQHLLQECGGRIVLFDNFIKDENKKAKQLLKLIEKVDQLPNRGKRYTDENFKMVQERRERLRLDAKEPIIRQEALSETSLLIDALDKLQRYDDCLAKLEPLQKLLSRDQNLVKNIREQEKKSKRFQDLVETAESIGTTISEEMKISQKMKEENEKLALKTDAIKQHEEMMTLKRLEAVKIQEENKKLEAEREQLKLQIELDRAKAEKEEESRKLKELREEQEKQRKKTEELENKFQDIKKDQNVTMLGAVYDNVVTPLWNKAKSWWYGS